MIPVSVSVIGQSVIHVCPRFHFWFRIVHGLIGVPQVATASGSSAPFPQVCATLYLTDVLLIWECESGYSGWCFCWFTSSRCLAATAEHVHVLHHGVAAAWLAGDPRRARVSGAATGEWSLPRSTTGLPGARPCHPHADLGTRPYLKRLSFHATMTTLLATQTTTVGDAVQQKQVWELVRRTNRGVLGAAVHTAMLMSVCSAVPCRADCVDPR